jgi:hypothetical protein
VCVADFLSLGHLRPEDLRGPSIPLRRTDCTGDIVGFCEMSVIVRDAAGNPDDGFGISRIGQPAAALSLRT